MHPAERAERDAIRSLAAAPGMRVLEIGGAACLAVTAMPDVPMVNHTVGIGEDEPVDDALLDAVAGFYGDARYYLALTPSSRPFEVRERLAARGFTHAYDWMKFIRTSADVAEVQTELEVRLVGAESGDDFAEVVVTGYEMPAEVVPAIGAVPGVDGCCAYVAYAGTEPAAAGALFVSGDVAWLGFAATKPEHRRKGGQNAILAARLRAAEEFGVQTVVTETGVMQEGRPSNSYRNILRSGFEEVYVRENYLSP